MPSLSLHPGIRILPVVEAGIVARMLVADLRHFMNLPDDIPGPTRRMASQLSSIVRAATAAPAGTSWETALTCQRRPGRRACPGHIAVFRADLPAAVEWRCTSCGDEGVIRGWEDSPFDLRGPRSDRTAGEQLDMPLTDDVAATLRELILLDSVSERLVFRARVSNGTVVITGTSDELDELIDAVAAEANHEPNPRRQKRLDAAFDLLSEAPQIERSDAGEVEFRDPPVDGSVGRRR
jgi:hypothetical protein